MLTLCLGLVLACDWYTQWHSIGDPLLGTGNPFGLNLCRSCSCCHNLYEFTCTLALRFLEGSFLEVIHHLRLIQFFYLLCHIEPWALRGGGLMRTERIKVSHSLDIVQLKFYPYWQYSWLWKTDFLPEEKGNLQYHSTTNAVSCSNNLPSKYPSATVTQTLWE